MPLDYFNTNVNGSMNIFNAMIKYDCRYFIFSSTASIYGNNKYCSDLHLIKEKLNFLKRVDNFSKLLLYKFFI